RPTVRATRPAVISKKTASIGATSLEGTHRLNATDGRVKLLLKLRLLLSRKCQDAVDRRPCAHDKSKESLLRSNRRRLCRLARLYRRGQPAARCFRPCPWRLRSRLPSCTSVPGPLASST